MDEERTGAYELAYKAGLDAVAQQERSLDSLRARAGTLISAIAIATSFLGGAALDKGGMSGRAITATVLFLLSIVSCLVVLWPQKDAWAFRLDPQRLVDRIDVHEKTKMYGWYKALAVQVGKDLKIADAKIETMAWFFRGAIVFLTLEIVAWGWEIVG